MLNYRIVAALIAAEVFLTVALFEGAGPLLGAVMGAVAGAVVFAVGRSVLGATWLPGDSRAGSWLFLASLAAGGALLSFYFVISGAGGAGRWVGVAGVVAALALLGVASARLNGLMASVAPAPEEGA